MIAFYDTECYPNFWLLKFLFEDGRTLSFCAGAGESLSAWCIDQMGQIFSSYTVVSFNGNHYDVPMVAAALLGATCEQLKGLNDKIIVEKAKPWELGLDWKPDDHIDIMEVAPGMGSQKLYAGRIHCRTMQDLPYSPDCSLTEEQMGLVDAYCGNDLAVLRELYLALAPQIQQREELSKRYGIDLRSKSDAQLAEAVIKHRCEQALRCRIYKPQIDWNLRFRYETPAWLSFRTPALQAVLAAVQSATFGLGANGRVEMPAELEGLSVTIGSTQYRLGIGGLHSSEKCRALRSDDTHILIDADVASYYPSLILGSGKFPKALGPTFSKEYRGLLDERLISKKLQKKLEKEGKKNTPEWLGAMVGNEGGKIMVNGTFGKTGSLYSLLFAPEMMIQTTLTGQLALLMLVELLETEHERFEVVSGNTDGIVIRLRRDRTEELGRLIQYWESITGLQMETSNYHAIYSRDINNYFAVKTDGSVKRKGEYSKAGLVEKKNPDVEICGDAVAAFLSQGTPIAQTILTCRDIRKFVTVQKVTGGAVKLWGDGPRKDALVREMIPTLEANGWVKSGRKWNLPAWSNKLYTPHEAYASCFQPQRPEYLGKVIRWFYSREAPGPIIYNTNGNNVGNSWGAKPCMTLPDEFPSDVDYEWYIKRCREILKDVGYTA